MIDNEITSRKQLMAALTRLTKWKSVFTGWQLGTRAIGDAESDAVRDHREVTIILRAEVSALTGLLIEKGVFTSQEFAQAVTTEAYHLNLDYENRFPGFKTTELGLDIDPKVAAETMKGWKP